MDEMTHIMLVGLGSHAKRAYLPITQSEGATHHFLIACIVELRRNKAQVEECLRHHAWPEMPRVILVDDALVVGGFSLTEDLTKRLNQAAQDLIIRGVIIATDPLNHLQYAKWALSQGLSVLLDKPISTRANIAHNPQKAKELIDDYETLLEAYQVAKRKYVRLLCSVMVQRRYHPVFRKARELLADVARETNCPVTSIQSFHSDGQWRLPREILEIENHPYNQGYGKCSHSGYHLFDIVCWLLDAAESRAKRADNAEVYARFLWPCDFAHQLQLEDYRHLFPDYDTYGNLSHHDRIVTSENLGEIDAFTSVAFRQADRVLTLASINLVHNGFSQRGWLSCAGRDLYKGNGRLRHESHYIAQGPFQALSLISYQSREINPQSTEGLYDAGGEYHFDLHVFRNSSLRRDWKAHTCMRMQDFEPSVMSGRSRGHQEDAKRAAVLEFIRFLQGSDAPCVSELVTHARAVRLMSSVYQSAAKRGRRRNNSAVNVNLL